MTTENYGYTHQHGISAVGAERAGLNPGSPLMNEAQVQAGLQQTYIAMMEPTYKNQNTYVPMGHIGSDRTSNTKWGLGIIFILFICSLTLIIPEVGKYLKQRVDYIKMSNTYENMSLQDRLNHYAYSDKAVLFSKSPSSSLYERYLRKGSKRWDNLSEQQKNAVAGAWLRYVNSPDSFKQLSQGQKEYYYDAFESYLVWRVRAKDDDIAFLDRRNTCNVFGPCAGWGNPKRF